MRFFGQDFPKNPKKNGDFLDQIPKKIWSKYGLVVISESSKKRFPKTKRPIKFQIFLDFEIFVDFLNEKGR